MESTTISSLLWRSSKKLLNFTEKEWQDLASYLVLIVHKANPVGNYYLIASIPNTNPPVSDINSVWCKRISDIVTYDHIKLNFMKLKNIVLVIVFINNSGLNKLGNIEDRSERKADCGCLSVEAPLIAHKVVTVAVYELQNAKTVGREEISTLPHRSEMKYGPSPYFISASCFAFNKLLLYLCLNLSFSSLSFPRVSF
ncbi:hypothetical protein CEXT_547111 [Caerostris extrusa]|uniref:Uncharacterized protein n=1 Tax=Caerostris extrusa TaxID=172846 RepID=A0AAV4UBB6_CAEEX|nr:hypothetical protein CEXT_547111 [Caerostris extrusa]